MKIAIVGLGYVGLSNAVLLAQNNEVVAIDIISEKVNMVNHKRSPIVDSEIEAYLSKKSLNLYASTNGPSACILRSPADTDAFQSGRYA